MKRAFPLAALAAVLAVAADMSPSAALQLNGDPAKGQAVAESHCLGCHKPEATHGNPPPLGVIARMPHYSTQRLRRIVSVPPHHQMPDTNLSADDINNVAAYIRSLRGSGP